MGRGDGVYTKRPKDTHGNIRIALSSSSAITTWAWGRAKQTGSRSGWAAFPLNSIKTAAVLIDGGGLSDRSRSTGVELLCQRL
jgi:hypothetical protein